MAAVNPLVAATKDLFDDNCKPIADYWEEQAIHFEYVVETEDLAKYYKHGSTIVKALDGVNLKVKQGEYISIIGPSGSGKTTLLNMIGGLDKPTFGKVYIEAVDLTGLKADELAWLRCYKIGYIFQAFNLIPLLTTIENVTLPMVFAGIPKDEQLRRAREALEGVGLKERQSHKPTELSDGEQQRVAIARAIVNNPILILADEPTGNLDLQTGLEIINLLSQLNKENGVTVITATRDLKAIDISDRIIHLRHGRVERCETKEEIRIKTVE